MATLNMERIEKECISFLIREAELLDNRQLHDWLAVLSPEIEYRVPVRTIKHKNNGYGFSDKAFFLDEDFGTLTLRVTRLDSEYAWSENPPTRTRRMVSNFRIQNVEDDGGQEQVSVVSNLALYCFRGETSVPVILTGERRDVLRRENGDWKLVNRLVLLDTTILGMESLSIFL